MKILVVFHTPINAGYAMSTLERLFFDTAIALTGAQSNVYFAFKTIDNDKSDSLPDNFNNYLEINPEKLADTHFFEALTQEIKEQEFDLALCFDLQVSGVVVDLLRAGQVHKIVSYWGASISDYNNSLVLFAKQVEVFLQRSKPDLFIFESRAMQDLAIRGRGLPRSLTKVIYNGVDTQKFTPERSDRQRYLDEFGLQQSQRIAIYSGHMEERKGVHVLINAMKHLSDELADERWHLLICGNRPGEETRFDPLLAGHPACEHITFCGYRNDLPALFPSCDLGLIGTTGWDSFPLSPLEMASSGLPVLASDLQGLKETVAHGETGYLFPAGDYQALAQRMHDLGNDPGLLKDLSHAARVRITTGFSRAKQQKELEQTLRSVLA